MTKITIPRTVVLHGPDACGKRRAIVMYGPNGVGKTRHAPQIAEALGCDHIHDGFDRAPLSEGRSFPKVRAGTLHICTERPGGMILPPDDVLLISYDAALAVAICKGLI